MFDGVKGHFGGMSRFFSDVVDVFVVGSGQDFVARLLKRKEEKGMVKRGKDAL